MRVFIWHNLRGVPRRVKGGRRSPQGRTPAARGFVDPQRAVLRPAGEEFRPYQPVAPNRAALWPCCSAERFFGDASWGLTGDAGGGRGRSSPLAGGSRSRGAGAGLGSIAPTFPGPTAGADGCLGTAEVVCLGLDAKSSFSSAKPAFSRGYVCVIKSPEHCLFIAEIKTKLFLSFMALCVCICIY